MNSLIEKNLINQMDCGLNFSYILNDNSMFLSTEYKVLQNQNDSCFIKCMKMLMNGKIQLYYLTNNYKSLQNVLSSLDAESFFNICFNLISDIIGVKNNGFLSCQNIDISFNRIYVDLNTYKVFLIYLPINQRIFEDINSFENEIKTNIIKIIQSLPNLSSNKIIQLEANLSNGTMSLEDIYNSMKNSKVTLKEKNTQGLMKIVSMNATERCEIIINKDDFVIGKKEEMVDGVISFNKMISRMHCKINCYGNSFTITDLKSANGTYINRVRLQPGKPYNIKNGDIIRLANSDFQVIIE